ncbi:hypothetical protein BC832DRAFT_592360 [Gaertneriomyces semiglobifer]|nr:hypothetical protein BC832DRAFT_596274 [Gaertneriomyces semiglobifer]KAI9005229.1 hypothetical protein BC832DRAFT_592360 [Gaertneriomyces semiglobifer]
MSRNPFADESPLFGADVAEEPLFLQPNPRDRMIEKGIQAAVLGFVVITFIFSLVTGFSTSFNNLFLGVCLAAFTFTTVQLIRWYRLGDLDPKFKLLILISLASLILLCIVSNVYFWSDRGVDISACTGLYKDHGRLSMYEKETGQCWWKCDENFCLRGSQAPGTCKEC